MDKRYEHQKHETDILKLWDDNKVYSFDQVDSDVFSVDTPPPTVSGALHIGHVFSYTHADFLARYQRMQGKNVFYPMGFDDNGLPTERFVERKNKARPSQMPRSEFIALCLKECGVAEESFEKLWKQIGLSIDWNLTYSTISDKSRRVAQHSFLELYKKQLVERKAEPSLYCTACRTTVAQAELDNVDVASTFNTIVFKTESGQDLQIATTRPELLPACVAVFYHPDDSRYQHLKGTHATTPVFGKQVPILPDDLVDPDKGTGIVMCCTFGDSTDILWYKKHSLPFVQIIDRGGRWTDDAGQLAGLKVHDARKKVLELLEAEGCLLEQKDINHAVGVHERCKREIEYLILMQWFVKILDHKEKFLELGEQVEWYPAHMQSRYRDWVGNLAWDWCISRQRFYGVPFPVWHCNGCKGLLLPELKDLPIDPQETAYPGGACSCGSTDILPDTDVMDTWKTSSLTPLINAGWPDKQVVNTPMSIRPQAHDIIRTWAFYTIVSAYFHTGGLPWNKIVISGHVLAGKDKISKSKGNAKMTPEYLLRNYPADSIRYWAAGGKLGIDTVFSEDKLKSGNRLVTKLWNAYKFCGQHLESYECPASVPELTDLSKWLLSGFAQMQSNYHAVFEKYDYTAALDTIDRFFWSTFCDNYIELVKDQFFNPESYSESELASTKYALHKVGFGMLQMYAPFVPFVTEAIYQELFVQGGKNPSLHGSRFIDAISIENSDASKTIDLVCVIVDHVRKLKSEQQISLKTAVKVLTIAGLSSDQQESIKKHEQLVSGVVQAESIVWSGDAIETSTAEQIDDAWHMQVTISAEKE